MSLVKSAQRVTDHVEVFTPTWLVEAMLPLVKDETKRIDSRFLQPACDKLAEALDFVLFMLNYETTQDT